jgi:hypothetical protein
VDGAGWWRWRDGLVGGGLGGGGGWTVEVEGGSWDGRWRWGWMTTVWLGMEVEGWSLDRRSRERWRDGLWMGGLGGRSCQRPADPVYTSGDPRWGHDPQAGGEFVKEPPSEETKSARGVSPLPSPSYPHRTLQLSVKSVEAAVCMHLHFGSSVEETYNEYIRQKKRNNNILLSVQ